MIPLTWESRARIREVFRQYPPLFSEFTFANLFMWRTSRPLWYFEAEGTLAFFVREKGGGWTLFGPPFGPLSLEEFLKKLPVPLCRFDRIPLLEGLPCHSAPNQCDYVYKLSDLTALQGARFQHKRQLIKGCIERYAPRYEPIDRSNLQELYPLHEALFAEAPPTEGLREEFIAVKELLDHYFDLRVQGALIRIDNRAEAFMICGRLNETTAVGHAEKARRSFYGLSEFTLHRVAGTALQGFTYLNTEQDLGLPGLREAKLRWHPDHMTLKYVSDSAII